MATDPFEEILALKAENRILSNRAIDCEQSWTHERAERAELLLKRCYHAMLYHRRMTRPITDTDAMIDQLEQYLKEYNLL